MKKIIQITVFLTLLSTWLFAQELPPVKLKPGESIKIFTDVITPPDSVPPCACEDGQDGKTPFVTVGTTTTLPPGSAATVTRTGTLEAPVFNFGIPQGLQGPPGPPSGGTGGSDNVLNKVFNVVTYGAKGDGVTDDATAIQNTVNAAIAASGKLIFPRPSNFYRVNRTIVFEAPQFWLEVESYGPRGRQLVYMGPSGQPAVRVVGMKGGSWKGCEWKVANGISNSVVWEIGTSSGANSTAGFTFYQCIAEPGDGANNRGWRLGHVEGGNEDISQISWINCQTWGNEGSTPSTVDARNQVGWEITGQNTLQLTWIGGGVAYMKEGIRCDEGGSLYFYGFGGSQNRIDYHFISANSYTINGGRWEGGSKFLVVPGSSNMPSVAIIGPMIEDYIPSDGALIDFASPGSLIVDGVKIGATQDGRDYKPNMIRLQSPSGQGGVLRVEGGGVWHNGADYPISVSGPWRVRVDNVVKMINKFGQPGGFFNNK